MTKSETRRYEMLQRVRDFGETHRELFPATSMGAEAFETVKKAVRQLDEQVVSKVASARGGARAKAVARQALTAELDAVCRNARVIAGEAPGFADVFRLPRPRTEQNLLTTGRVFVREAEAAKSRFIAYGLPETFVASLSVLVDDFAQAIRGREAGKDDHTAARASIEGALLSGLDAVRKLDVLVANRLRGDPVTMAVWERDRHVDSSRRARRGVSPAPDTPVVAPAAPEPATAQADAGDVPSGVAS